MLAALEASGNPAMIIGGIAVIARGVARLTKDIDATISGGDADVDGVIEALARHQIVPCIPNAVTFAQESHVLLLRHEPSGVEVDLSLAWLPFELEAIMAAERVLVHGTRVPVPRVEDLVIYKIVGWRPQDQQDVERLVALHGAHMDLRRVKRLTHELAEALEDPERAEEVDCLIAKAMATDATQPKRSRSPIEPKAADRPRATDKVSGSSSKKLRKK
ncbi:MAG: DUF6036 family nucleotidyltransferase [Polyangiaceae bacterium]